MTYLRQLIAFLRWVPYVPSPHWNDEDARALLTFLGTTAGTKLRAHLRNASLRANAQAVSSNHPVRQCGVAIGIQSVVSSIEALCKISDPDGQETPSDVERLLSP